ncbi:MULTISPECIES: hypothetical protein [Pseudomonas]|uniref:hypothetical protein n=1 Tax=Pseudomonas TaxID=286 RepID=UPI00128F1F61|nr:MULTISPECIES: hypothetical protein [Pseudomonas]
MTAEQATNFGISLLPGERLLALGKVGGATNALDGLVWHDAALGPKATGAVEVPATSAIAHVGLRDDLAAQAGIPRDIGANPSSVWGKSIEDLKQSLSMDGEVLTLKVKSKTSGNAQVYSAEGGTTGIKEIQYSPSTGDSGSSKHKGEYYKITYKDGSKVKVVNPENYRPTFDSDGPIYGKKY